MIVDESLYSLFRVDWTQSELGVVGGGVRVTLQTRSKWLQWLNIMEDLESWRQASRT